MRCCFISNIPKRWVLFLRSLTTSSFSPPWALNHIESHSSPHLHNTDSISFNRCWEKISQCWDKYQYGSYTVNHRVPYMHQYIRLHMLANFTLMLPRWCKDSNGWTEVRPIQIQLARASKRFNREKWALKKVWLPPWWPTPQPKNRGVGS